jgi:hypothetical protein
MLPQILDSLFFSSGTFPTNAASSCPQPIGRGDPVSKVSVDLVISGFRSILRIGLRRGAPDRPTSLTASVQKMAAMIPSFSHPRSEPHGRLHKKLAPVFI